MKLIRVLAMFFMQILMLLWMLPFLISGILTNLICIGFTAGFEFSDNYADKVSQARIDRKHAKSKSEIHVK